MGPVTKYYCSSRMLDEEILAYSIWYWSILDVHLLKGSVFKN